MQWYVWYMYAMFSRISRGKQETVRIWLQLDWRTSCCWESSFKSQAHHIEWVIATDSSYRVLISRRHWLEENKSPLPLARHLVHHDLHHKPLRSLKWVSHYAGCMQWYDGMMLCYAWSDVSTPCYKPGLRTVNKTCKELMLSDNKNAQVIQV